MSNNSDLPNMRCANTADGDGDDSVVCDDDNMDGLSADDTYYRLQTGLVLASGFVPTANTIKSPHHTANTDQGYGGEQPSTSSSTMSSSSVNAPSMTVIPLKMIMTSQQPSAPLPRPANAATGKERGGYGEYPRMGEYQLLLSQGLDPVAPGNTNGNAVNDVMNTPENAEPKNATITDAATEPEAPADDAAMNALPPPTTAANSEEDTPDTSASASTAADKGQNPASQNIPSTRSISPGTAASHNEQHPGKRSRCSSSNDV